MSYGRPVTSCLVDWLFVASVAALTLVTALHKTQIQDWWFFRSYHPSADVVRLADAAGLNDQGRRLLYRGDPKLEDRTALDRDCAGDDIGCINPHAQIFILQTATNPDEMSVTAAHEMLHLAYQRLSAAQRKSLQPLLEAEVPRHLGLSQELDGIKDGAERDDEIHALLGSEYAGLSPDLESYYHSYFGDRSKVVAAYAASSR